MTNWDLLLSNEYLVSKMIEFGFNEASVNVVSDDLAYTNAAGEFRNLVRTHGALYARRLARKALRRRDLVAELV